MAPGIEVLFNEPPNKKGEGAKPNKTLVNSSVSTSFVSTSFSRWNLRASLSSDLIRTCKKAFLSVDVSSEGSWVEMSSNQYAPQFIL